MGTNIFTRRLWRILFFGGLLLALAGLPISWVSVVRAAPLEPPPALKIGIVRRASWKGLALAPAQANLNSLLSGARMDAPGGLQDGLLEYRFERGSRSVLVIWRDKALAEPLPVILGDLQGRTVRLYTLDAADLTPQAGEELWVSPQGETAFPLGSDPILLLADANAPLEKLQLDTSWQAQAWLDSQQVRLNGWLSQQEQALGQQAHGLGDSLVTMLLAWVQQQLHGLVNQVFGSR